VALFSIVKVQQGGLVLVYQKHVPGMGNPQSLNRYAYVLNNALRYTDPSGKIPEVIYNETFGYYVVRLAIQIYGSGASVSLAEKWQKHLNDVWNIGNLNTKKNLLFSKYQ
jgi:hypothetical protein